MTTLKKSLVKTVAVLFLGLLFTLTGAHASASAWADPYQVFDDSINGSVSQYPTLWGSPTTSYVTPNTLKIVGPTTGSGGVSLSTITTPTNFAWTVRFSASLPSTQQIYFMWNAPTGIATYDDFTCTSAGCYYQLGGNNLGSAGAAFPAGCVNLTSWCWAKVVRNGSSATFYIASDNNGTPGTWVTELTESNVFPATGASYMGLGASGSGILEVGGSYLCVNHVSGNPNYDCTTWMDSQMQWYDDFFSYSPYATFNGNSASNATMSSGVETMAPGSGAVVGDFFQPFGSVSFIPNLVWEEVVSASTCNDESFNMFATTNNYNTAKQIQISCANSSYGGGNNGHWALTYNNAGTGTKLYTGTITPTAPWVIKIVYAAPNVTAYYAPLSTTYPLSWSTLVPTTNIAGYYQFGSYFGHLAYNNGTLTDTFKIGNGLSQPCNNYISLNVGWDCFSQAIYSRSLKQVRFPTNIVYDSINDTSKMTAPSGPTNGTAYVTPGYISNSTSNSTLNYYYSSTSGWTNSAMLLRGNQNGVSGGVQAVFHSPGTGSANNMYGCEARMESSGLVFQDYGSTYNTMSSALPYSGTFTANDYLYAYMVGTKIYGTVFNELSSGVIGQPLASGSYTCTSSSGYDGFEIHNVSGTSGDIGGVDTNGAGFPIMMYNYGSNTPPSFPPFGGAYNPVEFFWDGFTNMSNEILNNSTANACTTATTPTLANGAITVANSTCAIANGTSNYQNVAVVTRVNIPGAAWGSYNPRVWGRISLSGSSGIYITPDSSGHICVNAYNLGYGANVCSTAAVGTSPTAWYDEFIAVSNVGEAANYYNVWGQLCQESSTGSPNFNSCVSIYNNRNINGTTTLMSVGIESELSNTSYGGAYPYFQARDYGNGQPPTTLSQFLRGY